MIIFNYSSFSAIKQAKAIEYNLFITVSVRDEIAVGTLDPYNISCHLSIRKIC